MGLIFGSQGSCQLTAIKVCPLEMLASLPLGYERAREVLGMPLPEARQSFFLSLFLFLSPSLSFPSLLQLF